MPLQVLDAACRASGDGEAVVAVVGDSHDAVTSMAAKTAAIKKAAQLGVTNAGIAGSSGPRPYADGDLVDHLLDDPGNSARVMSIADYKALAAKAAMSPTPLKAVNVYRLRQLQGRG